MAVTRATQGLQLVRAVQWHTLASNLHISWHTGLDVFPEPPDAL